MSLVEMCHLWLQVVFVDLIFPYLFILLVPVDLFRLWERQRTRLIFRLRRSLVMSRKQSLLSLMRIFRGTSAK